MLRLVTANDITDELREREYLLARMLATRKFTVPYTLQDVVRKLKKRDWQLWIDDEGKEGLIITSISIYTNINTLEVIMAVGTNVLDIVTESFDVIKAFAKANDCHSVHLTARKGWLKFLDKPTRTHYRLEYEL